MPSAPRRQAAARAARNIHHQYSTPFVPLPYHACDHRSTAGRYEQDPAFKAGGYVYRSYAAQMPDAFDQPVQDSGRAGAGASAHRTVSRGGRKDTGPKEAKLRTSSFPYDQYLIDSYTPSPEKTVGQLSTHENVEGKTSTEENPENRTDWLSRSPSPLINPEPAVLIPETPPLTPPRSPSKAIDGSSALSEPSASSSCTSGRLPAPTDQIQMPPVRPSQLVAHTPPGSPLQWWADLSQLSIPEEAREDDLKDEMPDESPSAEDGVEDVGLEEHETEIDNEGETRAASPDHEQSLRLAGSGREGTTRFAAGNRAANRPLSTSKEQPGDTLPRLQLLTEPSLRSEYDNIGDAPFRPRSGAFRRHDQNIAYDAPKVPQVPAAPFDVRQTDPLLVEMRQAWSDLMRAHDRMKEVMDKIVVPDRR